MMNLLSIINLRKYLIVFDIFMKRTLVTYFMSELGECNSALKYFNDETNINLSTRTVNPDYQNATQIILNDIFF